MVAPILAAAGVSAVGSVIGGVAGGKGAKKAQQAAMQGQRDQIAAIDRNRNFQYGLNQPTIGMGNTADARLAALYGLGGDAEGATAAFQGWRDATGYQNIMNEGLGAVNNARFAGGAGQSGSTLRRLQETGSAIADRSFGQYVQGLGGISATGANARGLVAGVGNSSTNAFVSASQNGTNARIGAINQGTQNTQNMWQNLANTGSWYLGQQAYRSSYGQPSHVLPPGFGG